MYGHIVNLRQCLRTEEVGRVVIRAEHPFVFGRHHGRQLLQVADHQQLHATEGLVAVTETTQYTVDGIEEVATHHRYLIDDQQVERRDDLPFLFAEVELALDLGIGHKR